MLCTLIDAVIASFHYVAMNAMSEIFGVRTVTWVTYQGKSPMSALGQKQTLAHVCVMSALPPKADIGTQPWHVRFVPKDIQPFA